MMATCKKCTATKEITKIRISFLIRLIDIDNTFHKYVCTNNAHVHIHKTFSAIKCHCTTLYKSTQFSLCPSIQACDTNLLFNINKYTMLSIFLALTNRKGPKRNL